MKEVQVMRSVPETRDECMKLPCGNCALSNNLDECDKVYSLRKEQL